MCINTLGKNNPLQVSNFKLKIDQSNFEYKLNIAKNNTQKSPLYPEILKNQSFKLNFFKKYYYKILY